MLRRLSAETQKTVVHLCLNCNNDNTVFSGEVEGDLDVLKIHHEDFRLDAEDKTEDN